MKINNYWNLGVVLLLIAITGCSPKEKENKKPNLLFIITDDQGYSDFSAYGGSPDAQTPNLDRIAQNGVRFTNAYVSMSICSPSRCGILTGRQQQRWGVYSYASSLPKEEITLAEQLKDAGYKTGMVGKSHYGNYGGPKGDGFPLNHGFDEFFGKEGGTIDYIRHTAQSREKFTKNMADHLGIGPFYSNDSLIDQHGYSTDLITNKALSFIDKNKNDPFFLMVSYNEVHLFTHQLPDTALTRLGLEKVPDWDPEKGTWGEYLEWYVNTVKPNTPDGRKRYLWHLAQLDNSVGKIMNKLESHKLTDNTLIVYVSDNGGSPRTYAENFPLRGNKYILEEGGIRVPMLMSWPGKIKSGEIYDPMVSALDIFPTVHNLLGLTMPTDREYDGVNLIPFLSGENVDNPHQSLCWTGFSLQGKPQIYEDSNSAIARHDQTIHGDMNGWAIREGKWKLRYEGSYNNYCLYDISTDIGEKNNVAAKHPELVKQLTQKFNKWHDHIKPKKEDK
ncbi:MAG: sulfatase-like hydrolase/transferase [Draconibacterium sp.]|nr:sulfatase-like hydrolase/transferase [Draconibacterium sp.]